MKYDVIVVGSGAISCSIAYELASRKYSVCRVGSLDRSNAASNAAGAMNGCFGEVTTGLVSSKYGKLKINMDFNAKKRWPQWAERLAASSGNHESLFTAQGTHIILNTAGTYEIDNNNYDAIVEVLTSYNEPYEAIAPKQITWLKPNDLVRPLTSLYIPDEHAVNSHQLLKMLDSAFLSEGGTIIPENAKRILSKNEAATGVELQNGEAISADRVIIAAGVHSLDIISDMPNITKLIPPLFAGNGVSMLLKLPEGMDLPQSVIRTPNRAFACGLHCVPRGDGTLYIGATNILKNFPRTQASVSDVQFLLDCAVEQLNTDLYFSEIISVQVGNRPISADGFPLIGECGIKGLWLVTGTYRDGLHQSPLLADYVANAIYGETNADLDLSDFTPIRAPLTGLTRNVAARETVQQMLGVGYECLWKIKPNWNPIIEEGLLHSYENLIHSLHPHFTPPPELIAFSHRDDRIQKRLQAYYEAWS
ncbi:NAD(P)/FAD-dependent oxidoreductase [Xenorhabdus bovienii]|uniref:NAD(P)/FAD-dependent oxidoreductase n=1 Tax=Xenorhabdus bovienii TaxID=40576 RepID=UPI0004D96EF9|nr:FAD-dependent oxidoreductase [Xenorhabdus bovienii]CDG87426.1 Similar to N-formimidoyl fortimicin A synthase [Xenorhabdus bovienii str. feltiae France]CDG94024.1 Similar to N-formimidoyl fortimicin A synthase [Xenorhabdus bovienii str. feltiae Florida]